MFKKSANQLFVSSTKSMTGHLLGASGGIEAIASVLSIKEKMLIFYHATQGVIKFHRQI